MFLFAIAIAVVTCCILFLMFRKETTWWEYGLVIVPTVLLYFMFKGIFVLSKTDDVEYLGNYITSVVYYEPWDEMVWVQKTREVYDGTDSEGHPKYRTETYWEQEYRYHSEKYEYTLAGSDWERPISKSTYDRIYGKLHGKKVFVDMHRDYDHIDGDKYVTGWDGKKEHCYAVTDTERYTNRIQASDHTIFKLSEVSKEEAEKYGLYEYPEIDYLNQNPILGGGTYKEQSDMSYINGVYGAKHQIHVFVVLFNSNDPNLADLQRSYWEGGNKNEFVVCIGVENRKVLWCRTFSWCDDPSLDIATRKYFRENKRLDLCKYSEWLEDNLNLWHRKEFKDFEYLQITLSKSQLTWISILLVLYNLVISFWIVFNEFENDFEDDDSSGAGEKQKKQKQTDDTWRKINDGSEAARCIRHSYGAFDYWDFDL